ncbi:hypothetical protein [Streptomyces sp. DH12]|uniref:hypothetical protein n=1 Tax=Streptomyces sp. DH12 TaxID=2857010 RepID=UPI001E2C8B2C|nr:hypothetical protein [Streptomyces sp. DH12]
MTTPMDAGKWPPSYPPRTPPPPKRPVEPPRPDPKGDAGDAVATRSRLRARIANRRAGNWTYDTAPWASSSSPSKAGDDVLSRLRAWGYHLPDDHPVVALTARLVRAAVADGGRRASVHLADEEQDRQVVVLVLSHRPGPAPDGSGRPGDTTPDDGGLLQELAVLGASSCGTETDRDGGGRRRWALVAL